MDQVKILAEHLQKNQEFYWKFLIDRVIDAFIEDESEIGIKKDPKKAPEKTKKKFEEKHNLPLTEFHINPEKIKWKDAQI